MGRIELTRQQIDILRYLRDSRNRPCFGNLGVVNSHLRINPFSALMDDIKLLEKEKLVVVMSRDGDNPDVIDITSEGLQRAEDKSWGQSIIDSIRYDPIKLAMLIVAVLAALTAAYFGFQNNQLQQQNLQLQQENAQLSRPAIIASDVRVQSGQINEIIGFSINNPDLAKDYYFDLYTTSCSPDSASANLFRDPSELQPPTAQQSAQVPSKEAIIVSKTTSQIQKIPAGGTFPLFCKRNYVLPVAQDYIAHMKFCVTIQGMEQEICKTVQITVLAQQS